MAEKILSTLGYYSTNISALAIIVTVIALVVSTAYVLRKLFNLRAVGSTAKKLKDHTSAIGNDGDESFDDKHKKADCDFDQNEGCATDDDSCTTGQLLTPRYPDPVEYCEHIQGEFKRVQQSVATRTIEKSLTQQQLEEEREVQRRQLAEIFRLMQEQQDRFGIGSMDDMQEQMRLYSM